MSELETIDRLYSQERDSYIKDMAREGLLDYCRALLTIAGADGEVSAPEMDWLREQLLEQTGSEELMLELQSFDFAAADLNELMARIVKSAVALEESDDPSMPGNLRMSLLYDCIRMAWADEEMAREEREAISRAAGMLGIGESTCRALHGLVEMENAVSKLRYGLLGMS